MRKYRAIVGLVIAIILIVGIALLSNKKEYSYYLAIGDYVSKNQIVNEQKITSFTQGVGTYLKDNKLVNEISDGYLNNGMTSKKLLEMIEKNVYGIDKDSLIDEIKKSKYITITLGVNDIINNVKWDNLNDELLYSKDVIKDKISVFKHNYYKIVEEIKNINENSNIMLVGVYPLYGDIFITNLINDAISEVANYNDVHYIEINDIKDQYLFLGNELYLNNMGQQLIGDKVIVKIKEIG